MKRMLLLAAVILAGCSDSEFVGKWSQVPPEIRENGVWGRIITLRRDGTGDVYEAICNSDKILKEETVEVSWKAKGDEASITRKGEGAAAFFAIVDKAGDLVLREVGVAVRRCERIPTGDE